MTKVMSDKTFYISVTVVNLVMVTVVVLLGSMVFSLGVIAGSAYATMLHQAAKA
jgi:hypothetical protein